MVGHVNSHCICQEEIWAAVLPQERQDYQIEGEKVLTLKEPNDKYSVFIHESRGSGMITIAPGSKSLLKTKNVKLKTLYKPYENHCKFSRRLTFVQLQLPYTAKNEQLVPS